MPVDSSVSSEIDSFFDGSAHHPNQKIPLSLKKSIRSRFPRLTKFNPLPSKLKKFIKDLQQGKSIFSKESFKNTTSFDIPKFPDFPSFEDENKQIEPESFQNRSANSSIMMELAGIWYNIRSKMQLYVNMFLSQVSCHSLKLMLIDVFNYGIRDLDDDLKDIFKGLYLSALYTFANDAC